MDWHQAIEAVAPYVVRISTPGCSGTGWLVSRSEIGPVCGIATAAHVVQHADAWDEPIRIDHPVSGTSIMLKADERVVLLESDLDTAAVVCDAATIDFPAELLNLIEIDNSYKAGVSIGWLGFPAVAPSIMCFFSGCVSAVLAEEGSYLVDGVAINGVSGGPAFVADESGLDVFGVVSAYIPNRSTGDVLPGLAVVRHVSQFHELIDQMHSLDEARQKEAAMAGGAGPPAGQEPYQTDRAERQELDL